MACLEDYRKRQSITGSAESGDPSQKVQFIPTPLIPIASSFQTGMDWRAPKTFAGGSSGSTDSNGGSQKVKFIPTPIHAYCCGWAGCVAVTASRSGA
jgi:hypothetical protein